MRLGWLKAFIFLIFLCGSAFAVELRQEVLTPPYKSISHFDVTLDITLDQVYNRITPTTSTRYYIIRIHNNGATPLNVPSVVTRLDIHLNTPGAPSNYKFFQFEGYRSVFNEIENRTTYFTNWTEIPFTSLSVPAGTTKIIGVGFDIDKPFISGQYNISVNMSGTEFFLDPDISACGSLSTANAIYTLTADISERTTTCFTVDAANVTLDLNGKTVDGTGAVGSFGVDGSANSHDFKLINGTIKEFEKGFYTNDGLNNVLFDKTTFTNFSDMSIYFVIAPSANITVRNSQFNLNGGSAGYQVAINALTNGTVLVSDTNITCFSKPIPIAVAYYGAVAPNNKIYTFNNVNISNCERGFVLGSVYDNSTEIWEGNGSTTFQNTSLWLTYSNAALANDNATRILKNFRVVSPFNNTHWFDASSGLATVIDQVTYLNWTGINNTQIKNQYDVASTNYSLLLQHYERFNFTLSNGTPQSSNFRLNNSLNGEIVNATLGGGDGGLSAWYAVNDTKYTYSTNTSYNPYTLNSHPSTAGYDMNSSLLTFITTGTWNITFYGGEGGTLTVEPSNQTLNISNNANGWVNLTITVSTLPANLTIELFPGENITVWTNTTSLTDFIGSYVLPVQLNASYWTDGLIPVTVQVNTTTPAFTNASAEITVNVTFVSVCTSGYAYSHIKVGSPVYVNENVNLGVFYANEYGVPSETTSCNLKIYDPEGVLLEEGVMTPLGTGIFIYPYRFSYAGDFAVVSNCECESLTGTDAGMVRVVSVKELVRDMEKYSTDGEGGHLEMNWMLWGVASLVIAIGVCIYAINRKV